MIVLIVDDQINIVEGIYSGINWKSIGVEQVLKAFNALEAKEILKSQIVDILLSDIEMPGESGLDLLRWVQEKQYELICLFLTSHADFEYAKEAVQLGGHDYILQPAKYEDIEQSIIQAVRKIKGKRETEKYSSYGKLLFNNSERILQVLLKEWFTENSTHVEHFLADMRSFNIPINESSKVYLTLIDMISDRDSYSVWDTPTLSYALSNIITEHFDAYRQQILLIPVEGQCFLCIIFSRENELVSTWILKQQLDSLRGFMQKYFKCRIACYSGSSLSIDMLGKRFAELHKMKEDNVTFLDDVFIWNQDQMLPQNASHAEDIHLWNQFLGKGSPEQILSHVLSFLRQRSEEGALNAERLKRFYQNFMQLLSHMTGYMDISVNDIFEGSEWLDKSLHSYSSVADMEKLIQYVMEYFQSVAVSKQDAQRLVDRIIQYIRSNIEIDIRRTDIADAVHLTPNYVSRLFKSVMNVSLKSFIITEKMNTARTLLRNTALPISMVAAKVGYANFSHFTQAYKSFFGVIPMEDRQN
ncbi:response regulator [Paenibacillus sp. FSL P2-0136]|uniref:response regulator n=1 Tax=Paenibacillus sp. FSL P2-0136 TaxID=2975317 RepID=UPI0030DD30E8